MLKKKLIVQMSHLHLFALGIEVEEIYIGGDLEDAIKALTN
jgi:hypothetical protein